MVGRRALRALAQAPNTRGAFGGVDGGLACECASHVAAIHGADAQGEWINGSRADDNQRIMTSKSFLPKKPVIMQLSADPSDSSFATPGNRKRKQSAAKS